MLTQLIKQAQALPREIESLTVEVARAKQDLHDLLQFKAEYEARVAGEVADETDGDGKKKYPNEQARKAEIFRRLSESEEWSKLELAVREARSKTVELEARLERARYEHRSTTTLLNLLAGAVQAGSQDILKQVLEGAEEARREQCMENFVKACSGELPKQESNGNGNGLKKAEVKVLEVRPGKSEGTIRAWCEAGNGEKVAVYAKNGTAKKLAGAVGSLVNVSYKELDAGWYAVKVG
jgi:hypothetical protein